MLTPHMTVSLRKIMEKFVAADMVKILASMSQLAQVASCDQSNGFVTDDFKSQASIIVAMAGVGCFAVGLEESFDMTKRLTNEQLKTPVRSAELQHALYQLMGLMESEMTKRLFFVLQPDDAKSFKKDKAFGQVVFDCFPSARYDIEEAGTCFALERYSASVHHSMSALEPALKALAFNVGAAIKDGMWKGVIDRIESKIADLKKSLPSGKDRNDRLNFLAHAAKEFFYFKDGWRNYIAHAKVQYDHEQALGAMNHAKVFMQTLAHAGISEEQFS
jgi:hypothetical protein